MPRSGPRVSLTVSAILFAACTSTGSTPTPDSTPPASTTPSPPSTSIPVDAGPIGQPVRHPSADRAIYFVMTDRFENGKPDNDQGGSESADPLVNGYLPADKGFYHGGDLAGLTSRLDYLSRLGIGAIWITPPFTNRWVQGNGTIEGSSAAYHGYWNIDWTRIDPHLGTDADMLAFIEAAHQRGIEVYFDIVINHTGDVIGYESGSGAYLTTRAVPYLDTSGNPIDLAQLAHSNVAPDLDPATSFPYVPVFANASDAEVKAPAWLNDVTLYHNRGNSTFDGESSTLGDFFGLDDLFTEHPRVVAGMTELTIDILRRFPIDGFRVDTVKHVNDEFWPQWTEAVSTAATSDDFLVFGEVFSTDPIFNSRYTTALGFPSLLDFGFNDAATRFVSGTAKGQALYDSFDDDDWYTDLDSNASMLVTFIGNHDIGRMGSSILQARTGASDDELLARMKLGFDLLFLSRGIPVVYYGDEQGFTGSGGDKLARQDMFATQVPEYLADTIIGSDLPADQAHFDPSHPLYQWIGQLSALRADHPALVTGAQISRDSGAAKLVYAASRIDRSELVEYLILFNNTTNRVPATFHTTSPGATFSSIHGPEMTVEARDDGTITVDVEPLSAVVLMADRPISTPGTAPGVTIVKPGPAAQIPTFRYRIEAELSDGRYAEVSFGVSVNGAGPVLIGTDDAPPYRVYWDNSGYPDGAEVEFVVTAVDATGGFGVARTAATLGARR